jgi:hypothetical protein
MNKEQLQDQLAALEREKAGYKARVAAAESGRVEHLSVEQLADRAKQVDAEIARVSKEIGGAKSGGRRRAGRGSAKK